MIPISIDHNAGGLAEQIYAEYRDRILAGAHREGDRLLPSRMLAEELGVSRNTVTQAYDRLQAEGYLVSRGGSGVYVAGIEPRDVIRRNKIRASTRLSDLARRVQDTIPDEYVSRSVRRELRFDFLYGEPSYENFPASMWARTLSKAARNLKHRDLAYPPHAGISVLRENLAGYLSRARGIDCEPEDIVIVHGTQEAIDLVCRLLVNPGDRVVVEQPFYRGFVRGALAAGAAIDYVPVDAHGICPDHLPDRARLAFVTPSHQFPTGGVLTAGRRLEVLSWARRQGAVIFEDDYDGEFRYSGPPVASMKSVDRDGSVIYVGTASKTFFPALRLGWMVVPESIRQPLLRLRSVSDTVPPAVEQLALAEFIRTGHFERHIFRARKLYARKRQLLLEALATELGDLVEVVGDEAGIHLLVRIPGIAVRKEAAFLEACAARGVGVYSARAYYRHKPRVVELLLGYSAIVEKDITAAIRILAEEIRRAID